MVICLATAIMFKFQPHSIRN